MHISHNASSLGQCEDRLAVVGPRISQTAARRQQRRTLGKPARRRTASVCGRGKLIDHRSSQRDGRKAPQSQLVGEAMRPITVDDSTVAVAEFQTVTERATPRNRQHCTVPSHLPIGRPVPYVTHGLLTFDPDPQLLCE